MGEPRQPGGPELRSDSVKAGCCPIDEAHDRERVTLQGTLRTVTLRPRGGVPALEAELYDGSGLITVIWLGRRRITGIEPGRPIKVDGRIGFQDKHRVIFNPRYELQHAADVVGAAPTAPPVPDTVEAVVRAQLSRALGGRRGMVEAAVPTITFTVTYVSTKNLTLAIGLSVAVAVLLLARAVPGTTVQYVLNGLVGIGVGCFFVWRRPATAATPPSRRWRTSCPGSLYNTGYGALMALSILVRWPVVGLMVGSVSDEPTAWHRDRQVVRLCSHLTWVLVVPCVLRVSCRRRSTSVAAPPTTPTR